MGNVVDIVDIDKDNKYYKKAMDERIKLLENLAIYDEEFEDLFLSKEYKN